MALNFDGIDDHLFRNLDPDDGFRLGDTYGAIGAWVRLPTDLPVDSDYEYTIFEAHGQSPDRTPHIRFSIKRTSATVIQVIIAWADNDEPSYASGSMYAQITSADAGWLLDGNWHFVLAQRQDGGGVDVYIDSGTNVYGTINDPGGIWFQQVQNVIAPELEGQLIRAMSIGRSNDVETMFFEGGIDKLMVFNQELTAGEISQLGAQRIDVEELPASIDAKTVNGWPLDTFRDAKAIGDDTIGQWMTGPGFDEPTKFHLDAFPTLPTRNLDSANRNDAVSMGGYSASHAQFASQGIGRSDLWQSGVDILQTNPFADQSSGAISLWMLPRVDDFADSNGGVLLAYTSAGLNNLLRLQIQPTGELRLIMYQRPGAAAPVFSLITLIPDIRAYYASPGVPDWLHLVVQSATGPERHEAWINGVDVTSGITQHPTTPGFWFGDVPYWNTSAPVVNFGVGRDVTVGSAIYYGLLDEVMYFKRELTPTEIAFLWNSGSAIQGDRLHRVDSAFDPRPSDDAYFSWGYNRLDDSRGADMLGGHDMDIVGDPSQELILTSVPVAMDVVVPASTLVVGTGAEAVFQSVVNELRLDPVAGSISVGVAFASRDATVQIDPTSSGLTSGVGVILDSMAPTIQVGTTETILNVGDVANFGSVPVTVQVDPLANQLFVRVGGVFPKQSIVYGHVIPILPSNTFSEERLFQSEIVAIDVLPTPSVLAAGDAITFVSQSIAIQLDATVSSISLGTTFQSIDSPIRLDPSTSGLAVGDERLFSSTTLAIHVLPASSGLALGQSFNSSTTTIQLTPDASSLNVGQQTAFSSTVVAVEVDPIPDELVVVKPIVNDSIEVAIDIQPLPSILAVGDARIFPSQSASIFVEPTADVLSIGISLDSRDTAILLEPPPAVLSAGGAVIMPSTLATVHVDPVASEIALGITIESKSAQIQLQPPASVLNAIASVTLISTPTTIQIDPPGSTIDAGTLVRLTSASMAIHVIPPASSISAVAPVNFPSRPATILVGPSESSLALGQNFISEIVVIHVLPPESSLQIGSETAFASTSITIIIDVSAAYSSINTGTDPVYVWCVPDRQCSGRVIARNVVVLQPEEEMWLAFEYADVLDNHGATIAEVMYVQSELTGAIDAGTERIDGSQVRFRVTLPSNTPEGDYGFQSVIRDSNQNVLAADGLMRVREGAI